MNKVSKNFGQYSEVYNVISACKSIAATTSASGQVWLSESLLHKPTLLEAETFPERRTEGIQQTLG